MLFATIVRRLAMGDRMVDMSAKWSYQGVAKPLGEGVPHGDFTCKVVRGGGCCHRWGNPCGSKGAVKCQAREAVGAGEAGRVCSEQAKGRTGHCAWVGGGPRNRPIAPCSGGVTCQRRHGAEVKRKKEKRE